MKIYWLLVLLVVSQSWLRGATASGTWTRNVAPFDTQAGAVSVPFSVAFNSGLDRWEVTGGPVSTSGTVVAYEWAWSTNGTTKGAGGTLTPGGTAVFYTLGRASVAPGTTATVYMRVIVYSGSGTWVGGTHEPWSGENQAFWGGDTLTFTRNADGTAGATSNTSTPPGPLQGAPTLKKTQPMQVTNPYNKPLLVTYKDAVTGQTIASETVNPGQPALFVLQKSGANAVSTTYTLPQGASYIGTNDAGLSTGYIIPSGYTWSGDVIPDTSFYVNPAVTTAPIQKSPVAPVTSANIVPTASVTDGSPVGSVGVVDGVSGAKGVIYSTATGGSGVTDSSFREGTGAIVKKLGDVEAAVKAGAGTGGTGTDMGPTNAKLDQIKDDIRATKERADTAYDAWKSEVDSGGATGSGTATGRGTSATTAVHTAMDGKAGVANSAGSPTNRAWTMVIGGGTGVGGASFDFAPWNNVEVAVGAGMVRALLASLIFVAYTWHVCTEIRYLLSVTARIPQSRGNTFAGSGGQITAGINAAILTTLLLGLPVAYMASADAGLGWGSSTLSIFGPMKAAGTGTVGQDTMDLFFMWMPVNTILTAIAGVFTLRIGGTALLAGAAVTIKWLVTCITPLLLWSLATHDARADVTMNALGLVGADPAYSLTIRNAVGDVVGTVTGASPVASWDPSGKSLYRVTLVDTSTGVPLWSKSIEALDEAEMTADATGVTVAHPARVWWFYVGIGFGAGMVCELKGLSMRLAHRIGGSQESAP